jgi:hypothetical protein
MDETPDRGRKNPLQFVTKFFASGRNLSERSRAREAAYREQRQTVTRLDRPGASYDWNFARNIYLRGGLRAVAIIIGFLAVDVWNDLYYDHLASFGHSEPTGGSVFLVWFLTTSVLWFFISVLYRMDKKG